MLVVSSDSKLTISDYMCSSKYCNEKGYTHICAKLLVTFVITVSLTQKMTDFELEEL